MTRVILVQEPLRSVGRGRVVPRIDYSTLEPYGKIEFLFSWGQLKEDDALENTTELIWRLRAKLHNFSDRDFLVCLGNPALIGMAVAIAAECNNGRVHILDWLRDHGRYRVVDMDLNCQPVRG